MQIAGVLMIFGVLQPKDPAVRKWLFGGFLVVVVGAVAQFGVRQFGPESSSDSNQTAHQSPATTALTPPATARAEPPPDRASDVPAPKSSTLEVPPQPSDNTPQVAAIPPDLATWAAQNLGARPELPADAVRDYPSCVASINKAAAAPDSTDALSCRRDLQKFHMDVIVAYNDAKRPYDRNLQAQEAALRKFGVQTDELPRYNYIIAEMDRLNGDDSEEQNAVHSLEERVLADINRCSKSACR